MRTGKSLVGNVGLSRPEVAFSLQMVVLAAAPTIATFLVRGSWKENGGPLAVLLGSAICLLGLVYVPLRRSGKRRMALLHGIASLLASYSFALLFIAILFGLDKVSDTLDTAMVACLVVGLIATPYLVLSSLAAFPLAVIPLLRGRQAPLEAAQEAPEARLKERLSTLQTLFSRFHESVAKERESLESVLNDVKEKFESSLAEQAALEEQLQESRQEVEQYRVALEMTKEDREAFLSLIAKSRKGEYWMGLALGVLSSGIVAIIGWLLAVFVGKGL